MYGFLLRPKWIAFHLLVFGSIASMIWLGFWQLDRLDARRDFNEVVSERIELPPVPFGELVVVEDGATVPSDLEWREVLLSGSYLPEPILWFNRSQGGLAGDNVLSPFVTVDGATVLVNRGFVPLGVNAAPAPSGSVQVLARVRVPPQRQRGELTDATDRSEPLTEIRRIDLDVLAQQLPAPVAPVYVDLIDAVPALSATDPTPLPPPTLDAGPHLSYAMQWWIFAVCVLVGWMLAVRRSIRTRRCDEERASNPGDEQINDAAAAPAPAGSDPPVGAESANSTSGTTSPSPH